MRSVNDERGLGSPLLASLLFAGVALALALADRISILDKGHVRFAGSAEEFEADESLRQEYLTV